ncbi:MAG: YeeE/YedE thiosulfate transporter family protein [Rhodospirillales bacterium]
MNFDPTDAMMGLAGGLLIGLAAAGFLLMLGRIAGISGIAAGLLRGPVDDTYRQNLAFVAGLVLAPVVYGILAGYPEITVTDDVVLLIAGGLLVGTGTRIGGGCTSGHGVCGLSRVSPRSIVATLIFMVVAAFVASVVGPMLTGSAP